MSVGEKFIKDIENYAAEGERICRGASERGGLSRAEMRRLDELEGSCIPIAVHAYQLMADMKGKRVPDRTHLLPDLRRRKGLHVSNDGDRPAIYIYGEIGENPGRINAADFRSALSQFRSTEPVDVHLHTKGGSFSEGVAIHNLITNRRGEVHGFNDGEAHSAGSIIFQACSTRTMASGSLQMVHYASIESEGHWNEDDLERLLGVVKGVNRELIAIYRTRWTGTEAALDAALRKETYFTPEQAIEVGLADFASDRVTLASAETTGGYKSPTFQLSACAGPHKNYDMRGREFRLWSLTAMEMRCD